MRRRADAGSGGVWSRLSGAVRTAERCDRVCRAPPLAAADRVLVALERETRATPRAFFRGSLPIQRARLYASVGDLQRALDVLSLGPPNGGRGLNGEFLGWQAFLHSAVGDFDAALELACAAQETSRGLEASVLASLTRAVAAMRTGGSGDDAETYVAEAMTSGMCDPILIAVRAVPDVGRLIARQRKNADWLKAILTQSSDMSLASLIGLGVPRTARPKQGLTAREAEVHELLAQGLTNEEIAKLLHISLSTTKVHVKHIYDKLGVRSRLEAARALRGEV